MGLRIETTQFRSDTNAFCKRIGKLEAVADPDFVQRTRKEFEIMQRTMQAEIKAETNKYMDDLKSQARDSLLLSM